MPISFGTTRLAGQRRKFQEPQAMSKGQPRAADRLYALNAGLAVQPDRSVYTPGKWQGEPITLSCNAYLIKRGTEWILFDTGIEDAVAKVSGGLVIAHDIRGIVVRTMRDQLADVGLAPTDIGTVILSHAHFDHIGNASLFEHARWYIQRREYEAMFGSDPLEYGYDPGHYSGLRHAKVEQIDGDLDVFGDGSVQIVATPGHTPGHCSLLVGLPRAGRIILSGDVAHYRYNLENRCVPSFNFDAEQSRMSMDRIDELARATGAQLWINHDTVQTATLPHAPAYFD
jgi:glyoxylase-like metal-dependent hydrolase (beta-lactamase superfamily II)